MATLDDLTDVTITSASAGELLRFNGSGTWVNSTDASALTSLNASNLASGTVPSARLAGNYTGITRLGTLDSLTVTGLATFTGDLSRTGSGMFISVASAADGPAVLAGGSGNSEFRPLWVVNYTSGSAASCELALLNDLSEDDGHSGAIVALRSSAHTTQPNYLLVLNQNSAPIILGVNSTEVVRIASAGTAFTGSVTATTFTGALTGNASTASALQTPRNINGVAFDGTANISITASLKDYYVPAAAMWPSATSGADGPVRSETSTNKNNRQAIQCQNTSGKKYFEFEILMPSDYSGGTLTAKFIWSASGTSTNSAQFGLQGVSTGDGDPLDAAFGTAQEVTDAHTTTANCRLISGVTSAITVAGSPAAGEIVNFRGYRDPDNGSDTLAATVEVHGVWISY